MGEGCIFVTAASSDARVRLLVDHLVGAGIDVITDPSLGEDGAPVPPGSVSEGACGVIVALADGYEVAAAGSSWWAAEYARRAGTLLPVVLTSAARLPESFGRLRSFDLHDWSGGSSPELERLITSVRALVARRESRLWGATLADGNPLAIPQNAITELGALTHRMGVIGEILVDDVEHTADLKRAFGEVSATYEAVGAALERFMSACVDPDAVDRRAFAALAGVDLREQIHRGRGSCGLISLLYRRAGRGIRHALVPLAAPGLLAEADDVFGRLATADYDLFDNMETLGETLRNEAQVITNLFIVGDTDQARLRIIEANTRLQPLADELRSARAALWEVQTSLGYVDQPSAASGGVQVTINRMHIGGSVSGSVVVNGLVAETITSSLNALTGAPVDAELKAALEQLHKAVAELTVELSPEEAEFAAHKLEELTKEATSPTPRKLFWKQAADGLAAVAGGIATLGLPVVEFTQRVVNLLTGGGA